MSHSHRAELLTSAVSASLVCLMLALLVFIPAPGGSDKIAAQQSSQGVSDTAAIGFRQ
jgi:hypothetical protein